jgi:DNA-binding FadR family transcriptional regulator
MSGAREQIARDLIADVAEARLRSGDRLPGDDELAQRFAVSRELARAAVGDLIERGIARQAVDGAAVVAPEARWNVLDPTVLEALLPTAHGPAIVAEYLEFRRLVEVAAAGRAAESAAATDLTALSDAFARMAAASEASFQDADVEFHQALLTAGHNRPLALAADPRRPALCSARRTLARDEHGVDRALPEHERILTAVAHGDAEAARAAMNAHLEAVELELRECAGIAGGRPVAGGRPETGARPDER